MPRTVDLRTVPITLATLRSLFARVLTELGVATGYPTILTNLPAFTSTTHLGAEINTAIDALDTSINAAAAQSLQATPANGTRLYDHRTGTHDVTRLHADVDRMLVRVQALSLRSITDASMPMHPISFHRTGAALGLTASGLTSFADGYSRSPAVPYMIRRNLLGSSQDWGSGAWTKRGTATTSANAAVSPDGTLTATLFSGIDTGSNDVYQILSGTELNARYEPSIYLYRVSTTGTLAIYNPSNATKGTWLVNLAALGSGWQRITRSHPAVTVSIEFTDNAGTGCGVHFRASSGGPLSFYAWGSQLERGTASTSYQPTSLTAVDLTNPINGAGVVFEPERTNYLLQSNSFTTSPWSAGNGCVPTKNVTGPSGAANSAWTLTSTGAGSYLMYSSDFTVPSTPTGCFSVSVKKGTAGYTPIDIYNGAGALIEELRLTWGAASYPTVTKVYDGVVYPLIDEGDGWYRVVFRESTIRAADAGRHVVIYPDNNPGGGYVYMANLQWENALNGSTYMETTSAAVTRYAEVAGAVPIHNLLPYSEEFDRWTGSAGGAITATNITDPRGGSTGDRYNGTGAIYRDLAVTAVAGATYTLSLWIKTATTAAVNLYLQGSTGGSVYQLAIPVTSGWQRIKFTGTLPGGTSGVLRLLVEGGGTAMDLWGGQCVNAATPGVYVRTEADPISKPAATAQEAAWAQNGYAEFTILPAPISEGTRVSYFGTAQTEGGAYSASALGLTRFAYQTTSDRSLFACRRHNGATGTNGEAGNSYISTGSGGVNIWDGARHTIRIEWTNYILQGVRYMWLRLYVDGVLQVYQDVAALYGATAWGSLDCLTTVDGNMAATVQGPIIFAIPDLPAGSARAA